MRRQRPLAVAPHYALLLELCEERLQIHRVVDVAPCLQIPHPLSRLLGVPRRGDQQLVEEPEEVQACKETLDQLRIEVEIAVPHGDEADSEQPTANSTGVRQPSCRL